MQHSREANCCRARTKAGKPCQAAATEGGLCFFHGNPKKAAELGRIGGQSKRPQVIEDPTLLATLDNPLAVRDVLARLIRGVLSGKLHPRIAAGIAPLLNLQLRVIEAVDIERTAEIERRLAEVEKKLENATAEKNEPEQHLLLAGKE